MVVNSYNAKGDEDRSVAVSVGTDDDNDNNDGGDACGDDSNTTDNKSNTIHNNEESKHVARSLLGLASKLIVSAGIQRANQLITIVTVGHLGNVQFMGAATLGQMVLNVCAFSLMYVRACVRVCVHSCVREHWRCVNN